MSTHLSLRFRTSRVRQTHLWVALALAASGLASAAPQAASNPQPAATSKTSTAVSPPAASPQSQIQVRVQVVEVPVTVLDKRGMPVIDLTENDFRVYEDGKPQAIRYFRREPAPPLKIGLILDTSNSARRVLSYEKEAATEFVFNMLNSRSSQNQMFLETFDEKSSILQDFTNEPDLLNEKVLELKAGGGKALYDAIYNACKNKLLQAGPPEDTRRVLVVISDGYDVQSAHTLDEAISMAHRAETAIYTIGNSPYGFTNQTDRVLRELADATGGAAMFPQQQGPGTDLASGYLAHGNIGDTSQNEGLGAATGIYTAQRLEHLADALDAIGRELDDQYFIGYTPTKSTLDGTYRSIRVDVLRKGVQVRFKRGYFALPRPG